ncbi:MAG: hypothetical protein WCH39_24730 [Schlesneria sp.]
MQGHNTLSSEEQALFLAATVHQARQSLYVLQNTLFAASYMADRLDPSPNLNLIQQCLVNMRPAIDRLSSAVTTVSVIARPEIQKPVEIKLSLFLKETFQLASFCLRSSQEAIKIEMPQDLSELISGSVVMDYQNTQIAMIRWILDTVASLAVRDERRLTEVLALSALEEGPDLIIQISNPHDQRQIRLSQIISARTDRDSDSGQPL